MSMRQPDLFSLVQHNNEHISTPTDHYPNILLNCDGVNQSASHSLLNESLESWHNVMIPINEGALKRIVRTFHEQGFSKALIEARSPESAEQCPVVASIANLTYKTLNNIKHLRSKVMPHTQDIDASSVAKYAETRDWERSYIRYIVWHPNCFKIAIAGLDDIIRVYTDEPTIMPVLKYRKQKWITSMAWRPYSATELAVGCENGIVLWSALRTGAQPEFIKHPDSKPISCVQWSPDGTLLATASIGDMNVLIWNVDTLQLAVLARSGPSCSLLKFSPNGSYLFSGTVGNIFRVWTVSNHWTPERWTINEGYIQSACWSPCNNFLLFVNSEDRLLYCLQFSNNYFASKELPSQAEAVADLSRVTINNQDVGGRPQQLAWDPSGSCLGIIFKDSPCVVVLTTTRQRDNLIISPSRFIVGQVAELPTFICFEGMHRRNKNIVLTVGWSSGRVQYIPCQ